MSTATPPLNDLVTKIRGAHPGAYDDMDDAALTKAVLAKYPQYSDLAAPKLTQPVHPEESLLAPSAIASQPDQKLIGLAETGGEGGYSDSDKANATSAAGVAAALGITAGPAALSATARVLSKHPVLGPMIASEIISKARSIPGIGHLIPPYSEILPFLLTGGKGKPGEVAPPESVAPPAELPEGFRAAPAPYEPPTGTATNPQRISAPAALEPSSTPSVDVSRKAVGQAVDQSLGVEPLKPNVPLRDQVPSRLAPKAEPTPPPKESSVIKSHVYDSQARELHITTHSNPNTVYVYGDVDPEQVAPFETGSKGKAWAAFKQQSSPLVAKIVNGTRVPVKPMLSAADAAQDVTVNRLAPAASDDLTAVLKQSVQQAKKNRLAAAAQ